MICEGVGGALAALSPTQSGMRFDLLKAPLNIHPDQNDHAVAYVSPWMRMTDPSVDVVATFLGFSFMTALTAMTAMMLRTTAETTTIPTCAYDIFDELDNLDPDREVDGDAASEI